MRNKPKVLLVFGPQGSGNHLFAKVFSLHPGVQGWQELLDADFNIPHDQEPFSRYWKDIDSIDRSFLGGKDYGIISVSVPFWGVDGLPEIPRIYKVMDKLRSLDIETVPVIIGRDKNILDYQQERRRGGPSWGIILQLIHEMPEIPHFISYELLYLYKNRYVQSLGKQLDFPVAWDDPRIHDMLMNDQNKKYVKSILDMPKTAAELKGIRATARPYWERNKADPR